MTNTDDECSRCDFPQGEIVLLNKKPVCGGCITQIASRADIAHHIALDRTPASECGFLAGQNAEAGRLAGQRDRRLRRIAGPGIGITKKVDEPLREIA